MHVATRLALLLSTAACAAAAAATTAAATCSGATLHNGTECHGPQLASVSAKGQLDGCCTACAALYGCSAFTFAPDTPGTVDCWLHSAADCVLQPAEGRAAG